MYHRHCISTPKHKATLATPLPQSAPTPTRYPRSPPQRYQHSRSTPQKLPLCNTPASAEIPPVKESVKTIPLARSWPPVCALLVELINAQVRDALHFKQKAGTTETAQQPSAWRRPLQNRTVVCPSPTASTVSYLHLALALSAVLTLQPWAVSLKSPPCSASLRNRG